ncbi:MAG TPA: sugar phosphate nucleotidyltransferase, partial [Thermodesulfovibrionales bacterium]|nr:sugar phosphate nucleotidyltransferase [Thermodesulfovibrionales bacterium]
MTEPINIFIPAAGIGERLLPITRHIPKPLLPIAGKPVLEIILEKVSGLNLRDIGINLHHKRDALNDWISRSAFRQEVTTFTEDPILGTGGALRNAQGFLARGAFLVHNADILSDIDLGRLLDAHITSGNLATLAVHDFPQFNTVALDAMGFVKGIGELPAERRVAFTGIAVYNPEFLGFLPEGASSVVDAWLAAELSGHRIGTFDVSGCYWHDIGTPSAYAAAVIDAMRSEGETVFIHPSVEGCRNAQMDGYVILEKQCRLPKGVS